MSNTVKITIKPFYKSETLNYIVGIVENLGLYVLSATDIQGFIMGIPGKTNAENPATAVFGISKAEFELKDTDTEKLDDLAILLMRELPKDRIIAENNLRTGDRAESIDEGRYAAEKISELEAKKKELSSASAENAKKVIAAIAEQGEGWFIYTQGTGKIIPTIDSSGAVQIFSKEEYARLVVEKAPEIPLGIQKMDKNGINLLFRNLFRYGILRVKADLLQTTGGEVDRDEAINFMNVKGHNLLNSGIYSCLIRYLQSKQIKDENLAKQSAAVAWKMLCDEFVKGIYIVPMCFEGEEGKDIEETEIFFSERALAAIKELKPAIIGIDKYVPASSNGRGMKFTTIRRKEGENEKAFIPVFTDIEELVIALGKKSRPFMITYEDLHEKSKGLEGVIVNSATLNFGITSAGMESIEKEKNA